LGAREQRTVNDVNFTNAIARQIRQTPAYELALRQDLQGGWSVHAKSGTSFRLQTVDELRPPWGSSVPTVLEPQTSQDFDIGVRYADTRLAAGFSLFRMRIENEIMYHPTVFKNVNLPPTERRGVEMDVRWRVNASATIEGGYSYTDAQFISGSVGGISVAGKQVPLVPLHKASMSAVWRASERTSMTFRTTYSGRARLDNDQQNTSTFQKPSSLVSDLVVIHEKDQWRLRASVLNLTNESYFTYGGLSGGSYYAYPAMGRSVLLTMERRF
jgi:iron complex outermembrane receptor protein